MMNSSFLSSAAMLSPRPGGLFDIRSKRRATLAQPQGSGTVRGGKSSPVSAAELSTNMDHGLAAMTACELNRDGVLLIDEDGSIQYANSAAAKLLGIRANNMIGQPLVGGALDSKLAPPALVSSWLSGDRCFNLRRSGPEVADTNSSNEQLAEPKTLQLFYDVFAAGNGLPHRHLITIRDISDQADSRNIWKQQAHTDVLTGLPNRRSFINHLKRKMINDGEQARFAVVFIDLNDFKHINDNYGHHIGDDVLRLVGARLKDNLSEPHFCARLSGDEFAIIMDGTKDKQSALLDIHQIESYLSGPANIQQQTVDISVSAGFGLCNGTQKTPEALLEAADAAMYRCKRSKRAGAANQAAH